MRGQTGRMREALWRVEIMCKLKSKTPNMVLRSKRIKMGMNDGEDEGEEVRKTK